MIKKKEDQPPLQTPESLEDVTERLLKISELIRSIHTCEAKFNAERAALLKKEEEVITPLRKEIIRIGKSVHLYAEENKDLLTQDGKWNMVPVSKAGSLQWYRTPPAIDIKNAKEVLGKLKALKLTRFIRVKEEVNREALLRDEKTAESITGVRVTRQEKFAIRLSHLKERIEYSLKTKRWQIVTPESTDKHP